MTRLACIVAGLAWLGCKPSEPPPPVTTDLLLVSPGLPPLRELRYASPKGTKTTLELSIDGRIEAGEITSKSPGLVITLEIAVDDVLADGRMKMRSTIVDLTTHAPHDQPGAPRAALQGDLLKGLAITATLSPDGRLADVHAEIDDKKLPDTSRTELASLLAAFQQVAMPLPTAPVGVGAKWRSARAVMPDNALKLSATTTIDVTSITGQAVGVSITSEVHGPDQTAVLEGVSIDVKGITGTGSGTGTIDLGKLVMAGSIGAELHMEMTAQGERTPMMMSTALTTTTR